MSGEPLHGGDVRALAENVAHGGAPGVSAEVVAQGVGRGLGAAVRAELEAQVGDVALHGARAEGERGGDPAIAVARSEQAQHLALPCREVVGCGQYAQGDCI